MPKKSLAPINHADHRTGIFLERDLVAFESSNDILQTDDAAFMITTSGCNPRRAIAVPIRTWMQYEKAWNLSNDETAWGQNGFGDAYSIGGDRTPRIDDLE